VTHTAPRRRLDGQEMMERDAEVARLRDQNVSFREIAKQLRCSVGSVQKAVERIKRRAQAAAEALDDDHDALALAFDHDEPVGSVRFVGTDEMSPAIELFADERGRRFNLLDLYRHTRFSGVTNGVAVDGAGDVYVAEAVHNKRVLKLPAQ
jgi:DNA-binding CsgD family transcriptional regulator